MFTTKTSSFPPTGESNIYDKNVVIPANERLQYHDKNAVIPTSGGIQYLRQKTPSFPRTRESIFSGQYWVQFNIKMDPCVRRDDDGARSRSQE